MSKWVWLKASKVINIIQRDDFNAWIKVNYAFDIVTSFKITHGTLFVYLIWHIWIARNLKLIQNGHFYPHDVFDQAQRDVTKWTFLASLYNAKKSIAIVHIRWCPPPHGWWKLNTDGACSSKNVLLEPFLLEVILGIRLGISAKGFSKFIGK